MKIARATFKGIQEGVPGFPAFAIYNTFEAMEGVGGIDTTVSRRQIEQAGYTISSGQIVKELAAWESFKAQQNEKHQSKSDAP